MKERMKYMFDTNAFDRVFEKEISAESLAQCSATLFVTHIQLDEINAMPTPNEDAARKRKRLRDTFRLLEEKAGSDAGGEIPTETFVWGVSRWGQAKWSDDSLYDEILFALNEYKKKTNNIQDTLIAEAAIKNGLILVTDDRALQEVTREKGGQSISFQQFRQLCHI